MFQYNPTVNNISGQIYGEGLERAAGYDAQGIIAQAQADLMRAQRRHDMIVQAGGMVGDAAKKIAGFMIGGPAGAAMASGMGGGGESGGEGGGGSGGGLFDTIINAYTKKEQDKSDAKIYGSLMKVIAPAFGKDGNGILQTFNSFEKDSERADFGRAIAGSLGVIGNMYAQTNRFGLQQQGQQIQQNAPYVALDIKNRQNIAGGEGTVPLPEEPPLPVMDDSTLPPSQPRQPSPDALSAAGAWYNQSKGNSGMIQSGAMRPFYR